MSEVDCDEESSTPLPEEKDPERLRCGVLQDHQEVLREFIEEYKNQRLLWDPQHNFFNNKYQRNKGLNMLADILRKADPKATQLTVRKQINSLRTNYRKERKKWGELNGSVTDEEMQHQYRRRSWRFHALRFLDEIQPVTPTKNSEGFDNEGSDSENESHVKSASSNMITYKTSRKRPRQEEVEIASDNEDDPFENTEPDAEYEYLEIPSAVVMTKEEYEIIGRNVALKLKRMTDNQRNHAEWLIHKVLSSGLNRLLNTDTDLVNLRQEAENDVFSCSNSIRTSDVIKLEN